MGATGTSGIKIIIGKQLLVLISGFAEKADNNGHAQKAGNLFGSALRPARHFLTRARLYICRHLLLIMTT